MEWVEVYPAVWDKVLATFGWSRERMRSDEGLARFREYAKDENDLIYHELPLHWIVNRLIPPDIEGAVPQADHHRLERELERALEGPGRPANYVNDPNFDWNAAKSRAEALFVTWRERYGILP
ncbi:hypothetical protein [Aquisphaera insulae]|uniref:hypothetical protein n=1 Tax=Aquisphaera insulae TaxID=2712864 RepID=UPI0013EA1290|nr:hypothetical protein [Aquisphaera insulae]